MTSTVLWDPPFGLFLLPFFSSSSVTNLASISQISLFLCSIRETKGFSHLSHHLAQHPSIPRPASNTEKWRASCGDHFDARNTRCGGSFQLWSRSPPPPLSSRVIFMWGRVSLRLLSWISKSVYDYLIFCWINAINSVETFPMHESGIKNHQNSL